MKTRRIEYAREILIQQMNHWMLFPLLVTAAWFGRGMTGMREPGVLSWVLCSLFPLLFFIWRGRVRRIYFFILLHIGIVGLVLGLLLADFSFHWIVCAAAAVLYAVLSLKMQIGGRLYSDPIPLAVGVAVSVCALFLAQRYQNPAEWNLYYTSPLIGVTVLHFVVLYLQQYLEFLSVNRSSAGYLPAAEMFRSGLGLVLGYILPGAAILAAGTRLAFLSDISRTVKNFLLWLLRLLLSGLSKEESSAPPQEIVEQAADSPAEGLPPGGEPSWFWEVLEKIAGFVLAVICAYVVIRLLIALFSWLRDFLAAHRVGGDIQAEDAVDVRERCGIEKRSGKEKRFSVDIFLDNRGKIRRLYKRKILSAVSRQAEQEKGSLLYDTPREWEAGIGAAGMAAIYERARYSGSEVTGADVRKMREICR